MISTTVPRPAVQRPTLTCTEVGAGRLHRPATVAWVADARATARCQAASGSRGLVRAGFAGQAEKYNAFRPNAAGKGRSG